ncbi:hypothetical protein CAOG_02319 [Capsaspora owczarzaki ATCC 30864]|uniref:PHD-type domain-containing protein n=1 Tax=Capsaspora owczarzaki (strain ATCC 30864) TaxID=595528 RepID=A0A0D2X1N9_CAPO3|nr:hypothetical protein CAOG_02319 [Capsaspora owczarzaki ATCC 30864]KJE91139.1 hypothetical protein CAOG_002319 [Capsaspora owczarzaki ATCC 30864]|eukprot:XP_004349069.2 hypothetical protein CAOG_02319 [Capsaspora owczarzaki ATCC 30864]
MRSLVVRSNASSSLYNVSLSPGWEARDSQILCKALMKFGMGQWSDIVRSGCLQGKTVAQLSSQTQRILGQQSTAEFAGLHMDPTVIGLENARILNATRRHGVIINTGAKPSRDEILRRIEINRQKYELPEEVWKAIDLTAVVAELTPAAATTMSLSSLLVSLEEKKEELIRLRYKLSDLELQIAEYANRPDSTTDSDDSANDAVLQPKRARLDEGSSSPGATPAAASPTTVPLGPGVGLRTSMGLGVRMVRLTNIAYRRMKRAKAAAEQPGSIPAARRKAPNGSRKAMLLAKEAQRMARTQDMSEVAADDDDDFDLAQGLSASLAAAENRTGMADEQPAHLLDGFGFVNFTEDELDAPCMVCNLVWDGVSNMLDCDVCHLWFHHTCVGLPSTAEGAWVCASCANA